MLTLRTLDSMYWTRQISRLQRRPYSPQSLSSWSRRSFSKGLLTVRYVFRSVDEKGRKAQAGMRQSISPRGRPTRGSESYSQRVGGPLTVGSEGNVRHVCGSDLACKLWARLPPILSHTRTLNFTTKQLILLTKAGFPAKSQSRAVSRSSPLQTKIEFDSSPDATRERASGRELRLPEKIREMN